MGGGQDHQTKCRPIANSVHVAAKLTKRFREQHVVLTIN